MMQGAEWSSFNGATSVNEEADFMAHLFPNCSHDRNNETASSEGGQGQGRSSYSRDTDSISLPFHGTYSLNDAYEFFPVQYCPSVNVQHFPGNHSLERNERLSPESSSGGHPPELSDNKSMHQMSENETVAEDLTETGRKRWRISENGKTSIRTKKNQKIGSDDGDNNNLDLNRQNSSSCTEKECNGSQEFNGVASLSLTSKGNAAVNVDGKIRASRGTATDPQSIYARKRRERINERLKILQNLVPNGTKVDISTMLEEAVHYVKFLQHQIKLLSSDDLWMYAPLAYNGLDIGLDSKIKALI